MMSDEYNAAVLDLLKQLAGIPGATHLMLMWEDNFCITPPSSDFKVDELPAALKLTGPVSVLSVNGTFQFTHQADELPKGDDAFVEAVHRYLEQHRVPPMNVLFELDPVDGLIYSPDTQAYTGWFNVVPAQLTPE